MILEQQPTDNNTVLIKVSLCCLSSVSAADRYTHLHSFASCSLANYFELVPPLEPMNLIPSTNGWAMFQNSASRHAKSPISYLTEKQQVVPWYLLECWYSAELNTTWMNNLRRIRSIKKISALQTSVQF